VSRLPSGTRVSWTPTTRPSSITGAIAVSARMRGISSPSLIWTWRRSISRAGVAGSSGGRLAAAGVAAGGGGAGGALGSRASRSSSGRPSSSSVTVSVPIACRCAPNAVSPTASTRVRPEERSIATERPATGERTMPTTSIAEAEAAPP